MTLNFSTYTVISDASFALDHKIPARIEAPYSHLLWAQAWFHTQPDHQKTDFLGILISKNEIPYFFFSLEIIRDKGRRIATGIGEKHANYHCPILSPNCIDWTPDDTDDLRKVLKKIAKAHKIDCFYFNRQLPHYGDLTNPLYEISNFHIEEELLYTALIPDFAALVADRRGGSAGKRDRKQDAAISKLGQWHCYEALTHEDRAEALDAFFKHKPARLERHGVNNIFADEHIQSFVLYLSVIHGDERAPILRLFALKLNDEIIAVTSSIAGSFHASGFFNAFDTSYENKIKPGHALMRFEIQSYCHTNVRLFDLGAGDAQYKRSWLKDTITMRHQFIPVSIFGHFYACIEYIILYIKYLSKNSPFLWNLILKYRAYKLKKTGKTPEPVKSED